MTKIYSTLGRQIEIILKRGAPLSITGLYDNCCMSSRELISEQVAKLVKQGVIAEIKFTGLYEYVPPQKKVIKMPKVFIPQSGAAYLASVNETLDKCLLSM
jgi:hypothetical protein